MASTRWASPGAPAEDPVRPQPPWYRRRWLVQLVFGIVVAALTVLWAGQRAASGVRDDLDARLRGGGAGVNAGVVAIESEQLSLLRAITFTDGVGTALVKHDVHALDRLVTPLQANSAVPMVDIVQPDGTVQFAVRSKGAPAAVASRAGMPAIRASISDAQGTRGGRFSVLVVFRSGPTLLTIGPVLHNGAPVGVAMVMTPLASALGRLSQEVAADITAYDVSGTPIATTMSRTPQPLDAGSARMIMAGGAVTSRDTDGDREALGRLVVQHQAAAVLGVSLPDNSWRTGRAVMGYAALGGFSTIVVLMTFVMRASSSRRRRR